MEKIVRFYSLYLSEDFYRYPPKQLVDKESLYIDDLNKI